MQKDTGKKKKTWKEEPSGVSVIFFA